MSVAASTPMSGRSGQPQEDAVQRPTIIHYVEEHLSRVVAT